MDNTTQAVIGTTHYKSIEKFSIRLLVFSYGLELIKAWSMVYHRKNSRAMHDPALANGPPLLRDALLPALACS